MGKKLVIAEKPSVGRDIANAIGCTEKKDGYIDGPNYSVTWAVGHLIGLKDPEYHDAKLKIWSFSDLPFRFPIENSLTVLPDTAKQFKIIKELIHSGRYDGIVNAGDAAREGYLIQKWIYRMAGNRLPEKVLWLDSFTKEAVQNGFMHLHDDSEFKKLLGEAEARAEADWLLGMNYSRALTLRQEGRGTILSYGRCQTPLLALIVKRDLQIENFKPEPYFNLKASFLTDLGEPYDAVLCGDDHKTMNYKTKEEAENLLKSLTGNKGTVTYYKSDKKLTKAPLLYDLGTLQSDAGKKYGYSADRTLEIAQSLYEKRKILSYPRTDSKYLSTALLKEIGDNLNSCNFGPFAGAVNKITANGWKIDKSYCNDKKITDHPALIPVATDIETVYGTLSEDEKNIFDLVVKRFLAIFYPPYEYQATEIITEVCGASFFSNGNIPISLGYREILEEKSKNEVELPAVSKGQCVSISGLNIDDKMTTPPAKISVSNIIKLMEKFGIGTPATRADIINKIQRRGYIEVSKGKYTSTALGRALIDSVPEELKSPTLTSDTEKELAMISAGEITKDEFLDHLFDDIKAHCKVFESQSISGAAFSRDIFLGKCPACGGYVRKISPKGKGTFYGCSNYKKDDGCKFIMWSTLFGKRINDKDVSTILSQLEKNGKTKPIKGFVSKTSGKTYEASLTWDKDECKFKLLYEHSGHAERTKTHF